MVRKPSSAEAKARVSSRTRRPTAPEDNYSTPQTASDWPHSDEQPPVGTGVPPGNAATVQGTSGGDMVPVGQRASDTASTDNRVDPQAAVSSPADQQATVAANTATPVPEAVAQWLASNPAAAAAALPRGFASKRERLLATQRLRATAGRLAATIQRMNEAAHEWQQACAEVHTRGLEHEHVRAVGMEAGLPTDQLPKHPDTNPST